MPATKSKLASMMVGGIAALTLLGCLTSDATHEAAAADSELRVVHINDYEINYLDVGNGVPVVFVHGSLGDYRTWQAQVEAFSKDYRVVALSRRYAYPNAQEANESNDYSVTPHAEDLAQFLMRLDLGPVHLVGHSYGGYISLLTALEHPELVRSLTLGEPPVMSFLQYVPDGEALGREFATEVLVPSADVFRGGDDEGAVALFIGGVLNDSDYYSKASQQQKDLMMDNAFGLKGVILTENPFQPLGCDAVSNLAPPTLLMMGDRSPRRFTEIVDALASCIEGSELAVLPNASHGLEYENPEDFNAMVLEFIDKH